ncbi:armadillo-type protein [Irpex rosettiformis]|uniref:Armadillo-type protein n=1 Tax=Irpex rosettiformis TaxID=378272 RepID=A0ACB8ULJ3_9APHY|nr:armadillo-type protein [Irpex rosettiformis]
MDVPDIATLQLHDPGPPHKPEIPEDIMGSDDRYMVKLRNYCKSLPYSVESNSRMQEMLEFIILRLVQCIEARDYDPGFQQWDSMLIYWSMLKYPIPKDKRIALTKLYFHIATAPGMPTHIVSSCSDHLYSWTRSKKKMSVDDLRLPWLPIYKILSKDLFLARRQYEISQTSWYMGFIAETLRRFFHPATANEMLQTFVPLINPSSLSRTLAAQYYMLTFLPLSHPQTYLPMLFRMWESINSYMYDERMLQFLSRLSEMHVDPTMSDPRKIEELPDDAKSEGENRPQWSKEDLDTNLRWGGLYKEVGIFTEREWSLLMCKCLASMEIPLADAGSLTTGPNADSQATFELRRLPKANWRIASLARIIVYSMSPDGMPAPGSNVSTPFMTPMPSGMSTPLPHHGGINGSLGDYLSSPLAKSGHIKVKTYLAGCKALDSLAKLIASTEGFFHPTNSGSWTNDLSAFVKYIVFDFNKRWHEEQKADCKTPIHRRLTRQMKRELVKSLRTVCFLAMFSQDSGTVSNIQSALKSMSVLEPDLILHPILERAVPALEALIETQRTIAVIKALGAVAPALVCREIYYPGAKHLLPILELLLPGIDLNDPLKTFCTTAFLVEVAQYIKFGELSAGKSVAYDTDTGMPVPESPSMDLKLPHSIDNDEEEHYSKEEEDAIVITMSEQFADWVAAFLRRVITLFENLPEEGGITGTAGGQTELNLVDAVCAAFSQICVHLSEPLYDMVLNMVYDYASTNVRTNAVRAIHQLVECVANANPQKTLAKFLPMCIANIRNELEHGASSVRTTSLNSTSLPSDATLHWNLAILRGSMYNDGKATLKYKDDLLDLFKYLQEKTLSKRGFSSTGKLISSTLLTLTHTYPLENKFVNIDEWNNEEFQAGHHRSWGRLYAPEDVEVSWHVPDTDEIDFALQIFKEAVEPTLLSIDALLDPDIKRDSVWRNDFCRHLSLVRNAFSGIPTFVKEVVSAEETTAAVQSSDILHEIPEMIAVIEPLQSGFALADPEDPRHKYITTLKRRFGELLHRASEALRTQGEENILDAVHMLLRAIRTYMLDYGDSRDSYYVQLDRYQNELNITRQYAGQKHWPRAVLVRRARLYHAARLRWNSVERRRGTLENELIDEVTEWCMWHYATVRESAQSLLDSLCSIYDGPRSRSLPRLYKALNSGTDDDRMKGALWTLNTAAFAKYAVSNPTLTPEFVQKLFGCQFNEKPSIQECVNALAETSLSSFVEPCYIIFDMENTTILASAAALRERISKTDETDVVSRCAAQRKERVRLWNAGVESTTNSILSIAQSPRTHWKYSIVAIRCLRTLVRKDAPMNSEHVKHLLLATLDSQYSIRYYSQRAIMKITRFMKLKTFSNNPADILMEVNHNPLRHTVHCDRPTSQYTTQWLADFKAPLDIKKAQREPLLFEKVPTGWLAWSDTSAFLLPPDSSTPMSACHPDCQDALNVIRKEVTQPSFWEKLAKHYTLENHSEVIVQDNASCIKSLFEVLQAELFEALKPTLENLLADKDKNKQRGAAELLSGIVCGSKHWAMNDQAKFWKWFTPQLKRIFSQTNNDMVSIWTSFFEYAFYNKDPRRVQPLVDFIMEEFENVDFNAETTFDVVKVLSFFRAMYEELDWKFSAWAEDVLRRCWPEIRSEHDDALAYIAEIMAFCDKIMRRANASVPKVEVIIRESRVLPADADLMGLHGIFHEGRVMELVKKFNVWREERLPGVRAFQSTYDRVGIMVCRWLFQVIHDTHASVAFDYILPLMPELFRFTEINDNDDLALRSKVLLNRMCGVISPKPFLIPILDEMFTAIQTSSSWRVRLKILPLVQVYYFRQGPCISEIKTVEMIEVICRCLDDEIVEVREMAATTLTGILRVSPRRSVVALKDRFVRLAKNSRLLERRDATYPIAIRQRHAAILGICALVESYPYTIERWLPALLTGVLVEYTYDPIPISTTVRKCASNFKKTHQDTWHEDSKKFTEDQLAALSTLLTGSSYYA